MHVWKGKMGGARNSQWLFVWVQSSTVRHACSELAFMTHMHECMHSIDLLANARSKRWMMWVSCVYTYAATVCMSGERGELKVMSFCFLLVSFFSNPALHRIVALLLEMMEEISMSGYGTVLCSSMPSSSCIWSSSSSCLSLRQSKSQDVAWWGQKDGVTDQLWTWGHCCDVLSAHTSWLLWLAMAILVS